MNVVNEVVAWLTDPAQWSGPDGIPVRTLQHLWYSLLACSRCRESCHPSPIMAICWWMAG